MIPSCDRMVMYRDIVISESRWRQGDEEGNSRARSQNLLFELVHQKRYNEIRFNSS